MPPKTTSNPLKNYCIMNKFTILTVAALAITTLVHAQSDLVVGTTFPLNIQNKNTFNDIFLLHNARYNSGDEVLQWETTHGSFGLRGLRFHTNSGIHFYATSSATSTGVTFTPVTRFFIGNSGNIGIGTIAPADKLHIVGGGINVDNATPSIATGTGASELGRYLRITNATGLATPAGLKAGGLLIADDFNFASPAKNDLVVKGKLAIGGVFPGGNTHAVAVTGTLNASALYINNHLVVSSQWTAAGGTINYPGAVGIGTSLASNPNNYALSVNGKFNASTMHITGAVGIGTTLANNPNNYLLGVNGKIGAKDVQPTYQLPGIYQIEAYIKKHKHLEGIPAAGEIAANGYNVSDIDAVLTRKIEELTLYIIQQQKEIDALKARLEQEGK
jgi:hypothetical protein